MIEIKEISNADKLVKNCAAMVQKYSWGEDFPIKAIDEFRQAECIVVALDNKKLVGCVGINRVASPDKIDNGKLWFADAVVLPRYRKLGIYKKLYAKGLAYVKKLNEVALTCTDNLIMVSFFLESGWQYYRSTRDEGDYFCLVFRLLPTR